MILVTSLHLQLARLKLSTEMLLNISKLCDILLQKPEMEMAYSEKDLTIEGQ